MKQDLEIRLQKFIADAGVTSRRKAEEMILEGRVEVNGRIVRELGTKVNPNSDVVSVDAQIVSLDATTKLYLLLHKPRGYITSVSDPEGRKTVMDLVSTIRARIYPVGRLDYLSEGLLFMTNDGEIANMMMHPKYNIVKVYEVKVFGAVTENILKKLRAGVRVEGEFLKPISVRVVKQLQGKTWLEIRLGEGKNREIRKLCDEVGVTIDKLKRMAIGALTIDGIAPGKHRYLTKKETLEGLGMNKDGSAKKNQPKFISSKKSVDVSRKVQNATLADDQRFTKFKKETYFTTVKELKEKRALEKKGHD